MVDEPQHELPPLLPPAPGPAPDLVAAVRAAGADWLARRRLTFRPGRVVLVVALAALLGVGAWALLVRSPAAPVDEQLPRGVPPGISSAPSGAASQAAAGAGSAALVPTTTVSTVVVVDVGGAVNGPGLVRVGKGARVADVVAAAGGATHEADLDRLNLAAPVADGERIFVPRLGQGSIPVAVNGDGAAGEPAGGPGSSTPAGPVDLNHATAEQLDTLPGVGPATAAAIVTYRTQHGPFASVDDLLQVHGIGPAKLAALRSKVRV
jgi:competence protein ComEA